MQLPGTATIDERLALLTTAQRDQVLEMLERAKGNGSALTGREQKMLETLLTDPGSVRV